MSESQNMRKYMELTEGRFSEEDGDWRQHARLEKSKELMSDPNFRQEVKDGLSEMIMGMDGPLVTVSADAIDQLLQDDELINEIIRGMIKHGIS